MKFRLGFIGVGIMGEAMCRRLLDRGWSVNAWNLEPERLDLITPYGATACVSPRAVAEASDVILMCVLHTQAVRDCVFGQDGIASAKNSAGKVLLDHSTIDPFETRAMATELAAAAGMTWIDAPVSGGPGAARKGTLAVMCGGDTEAMGRVGPVLGDLASRYTLMGPTGAGQTTKMINQVLVCTNYAVMAEALILAERAELDASRIPECLGAGFAESRLLRELYPQMMERRFNPPLGYARQISKDLTAAKAFAGKLGVSLPVLEAAAAQYAEYVSDGNGMTDGASIIRHYENKRVQPN